MYLVGLTGGIASGKSTVANVWDELGATIIDADLLAREVVEPGTVGLERLVAQFGSRILEADGSLNRSALAGIVFDDADQRKTLESIVHPLIQELSRERISEASSEIVVYVIPLMVETESSLPFDLVVTVEAPEKEQIRRMVEDRKMETSSAVSRIRAQASPAMRAQFADHILNSNQSIELLKKDARKLFKDIQDLASKKSQVAE
jgi:dephospho-CoA kinase